LIELDQRWGQREYWLALKRATPELTPYYLLAALDMKVDDDNSIARADPQQQIFIKIILRSLWIAFVVTLLCFLIAYPVANFMLTASPILRALTLISVLLPFWTSLLVRTSAWIVILQREGMVNQTLQFLTITDQPLELIFNRFGVYVSMIHILLPFMILPIYSVMKGIPPNYLRAANSLGAHPVRAFFDIYFPLTLPGVGAGCLLTFIVGVGYYITPALVGGAQDQMVGYFIAFFTNVRLNWGMASSLSIFLLICILSLYIGLGRFIGISRLA
ncbi:MAG: ABC transporter permease, partial [Gammaproteobacteria bacterium]|nr:ABC transporter permease [Gammaproteobacteria bacterium]